jgi:hypothetical protein
MNNIEYLLVQKILQDAGESQGVVWCVHSHVQRRQEALHDLHTHLRKENNVST